MIAPGRLTVTRKPSLLAALHRQLDDLDRFCNERFAGATIALRQESSLQLLMVQVAGASADAGSLRFC